MSWFKTASRTIGERDDSIALQSLLLTSARTIGFVASIGIPLVLVRVLDQTEYGLYKQIFLIVGTAQPILQLGLSAAIYYFVPRDEDGGRDFLLQTALVLPVMGLLGGVGLMMARDPLAQAMNTPAIAEIMPAIALIVFLATPAELIIHALIVERRPKLASGLLAGSELLKATALISVGAIFREVEPVAWAGLAVPVLQITALIAYLSSRRREVPFRFDWMRLRTQLAYALPFWLTVLCQIGLEKAHQFYISGRTTPDVFAVYANGIFQIPIAGLLVQSVAEVLIVRSSASYREGDIGGLRSTWRTVTNRLTVPLTGLFVWAWAFSAPLILTLFGEPYAASIPIFRIVLLAIPLGVIVDHGILRATGDTSYMLRAAGLGLLASVLVLLVLTPLDMELGAVTAYVVGVATARVAGAVRVSRYLGQAFLETLPLAATMQSLAVGMVAAGSALLVTLPFTAPIVRVAISVPVFGGVYWGLILALGIIPASEPKELLQRFRSRHRTDSRPDPP